MTELDIRGTLPIQIDIQREHEETEYLKAKLQAELGRIGLSDYQLELVDRSAELAYDLHREDRRTYEPYVNHLLRVALSLIEFGVKDADTIAAALLHDSLEDHATELIQKLPEEELPREEQDVRTLGYLALSSLTNERIANIVRELSNPIVDENDDKNASYAKHIRHLTECASLEALEIKICDFIDNTDAHGQEAPAKRESLDYKQEPIYPMIIQALPRLHGRPSADNVPAMQQLLESAQKGAMRRLEGYAQKQ